MATVGLVRDKRYLLHVAPNHPEQPARLEYIDRRLEETGLLDKVTTIIPRPAEREDILRVHAESVIDQVEATRGKATGFLDPDTYACRDSADVAMLAAGGAIVAAEAIARGDVQRALVLARPPGHHATRLRSMGFCLYNNVAIAARYLQANFGIERIAIIDFDVHHGNGTQDVFFEDPSVFYLSLHQYGIFPGTGTAEENGVGAGEGTTLNVPLESSTLRWEYVQKFSDALAPALAFEPQFVILSAGFDAHYRDPLASMGLEAADFYEMTRIVIDRCRRRNIYGILSCLEGGYNLMALGECVEQHLRALLED